jgi:hypothetical protein
MAAIDAARSRALAVLRVRGIALGTAVLPAGLAAVLGTGAATGRLQGAAWSTTAWAVAALAALAALAAAGFAAALLRAHPAQSPLVQLTERQAPDLYRLIRELAARLEVPMPTELALTPDCDSWLEDRTVRRTPEPPATTLVIGSPFLWWMRIAELRALLAPVVAGTGAAADPDISAARRFVRNLDAVAGGTRRTAARALARALLRACRRPASALEREVAGWASEHAQQVDFGLRVAAQEQVGLAYAGWDRLLTRVALPAWRMGRWPSRLNAGVVSALTELSRRDRLAEGFSDRLGQRPACDLLETPGDIDEAASLLAAEVFHGGDPGATPLDWAAYPEEIVDRIWRTQAAELHTALHDTERPGSTEPEPPDLGFTLDSALTRLAAGEEQREQLADALDTAQQHAPGPRTAPVVELQPPRTGRELLAEHTTAAVCCALVDTAGGRPGMDWLDGPALQFGGGGPSRSEVAGLVQQLVDTGADTPLRSWLRARGARVDKPLRLG